jgi:5-methyltetrahydrofolate--homocysteine methyltransferase
MMLKGAGYKIVDLGADVAPERFIDAARMNKANVVALSALLTTTMVQMKSVIQALQASGLKMPVIVGGAPLTQDYADQVGANGYAPDAASAVDVVNKLI